MGLKICKGTGVGNFSLDKEYKTFFLEIAWYNVNNYSLVELIQKMGKLSQKYTIAILGTNEYQILIRLIYQNVPASWLEFPSKI